MPFCVGDTANTLPVTMRTHTQLCDPHILEFACFEIWNSVSDQSCMEQNPVGFNCIRLLEILKLSRVLTLCCCCTRPAGNCAQCGSANNGARVRNGGTTDDSTKFDPPCTATSAWHA